MVGFAVKCRRQLVMCDGDDIHMCSSSHHTCYVGGYNNRGCGSDKSYGLVLIVPKKRINVLLPQFEDGSSWMLCGVNPEPFNRVECVCGPPPRTDLISADG